MNVSKSVRKVSAVGVVVVVAAVAFVVVVVDVFECCCGVLTLRIRIKLACQQPR